MVTLRYRTLTRNFIFGGREISNRVRVICGYYTVTQTNDLPSSDIISRLSRNRSLNVNFVTTRPRSDMSDSSANSLYVLKTFGQHFSNHWSLVGITLINGVPLTVNDVQSGKRGEGGVSFDQMVVWWPSGEVMNDRSSMITWTWRSWDYSLRSKNTMPHNRYTTLKPPSSV